MLRRCSISSVVALSLVSKRRTCVEFAMAGVRNVAFKNRVDVFSAVVQGKTSWNTMHAACLLGSCRRQGPGRPVIVAGETCSAVKNLLIPQCTSASEDCALLCLPMSLGLHFRWCTFY